MIVITITGWPLECAEINCKQLCVKKRSKVTSTEQRLWICGEAKRLHCQPLSHLRRC
jgi:hypothetical protein